MQYFEATTARGTQRYTSEMVLGPGDRIIVDGSSLGDLEWRVARLMPATLYSRMLARAAARSTERAAPTRQPRWGASCHATCEAEPRLSAVWQSWP